KDPNPVGPNNLANPPGKLKKFPSAPPVKGDIGPTGHTVNQKNAHTPKNMTRGHTQTPKN
ncbi:hypothetical protein, partial [Komagataeibacter sp. SM21]|uniref:hypothetical protein n=1 Tax=Komagataeibacter sp. SM21 TaxID=3242899 RepID=UPI0035272B2D